MLDRRFPNATLREKMVEVCKIYGLDSNKFMAPEEIRKIIDLSGEGNTFVRQIVRDNGEKAWLRIYLSLIHILLFLVILHLLWPR